MRLATTVTSIVLIAAVLAGCATKQTPGQAAGTVTRERRDGRLTTPPTPLSIADVRNQPAGSPQRAIMLLWFFGQWGSAPNIVAAYDPRIRTAIGSSNIAGAYAQQRASLVSAVPRFVSATRTGIGTFVSFDQLSATQPPLRQSFLLVKRGGDWKIAYDTLLEQALAVYVQSISQDDPNAKPSPKAVRAGLDAARNYRDYYSSLALQAVKLPGTTKTGKKG